MSTRKERKVEQSILLEIQKDLQESLLDIENDLEDHHRFLNSTNIVKKALVSGQPFHDSLDSHIAYCFADTRTFYKSGGYQSMLSKGVHIIANDSLRILITNLYQLEFTRMDQSTEEYNQQKVMWPFMSRHFVLTEKVDQSYFSERLNDSIYFHTPKLESYEELGRDQEFVMDREFDLVSKS